MTRSGVLTSPGPELTNCGPENTPPLDTWRGLNLLYALITRRLAADLDKHTEISLSTYEILSDIADSGGECRLKDLQRAVLLSQPGLSRKIERLELDGLVRRGSHPVDRRAVLVELTGAGRTALLAAAHVHIGGINKYFRAHLSAAETEVMTGVFRKLLTKLDADHPVR